MSLILKTSVPTSSGEILRHDGVANTKTLGLWDFMHRQCFDPNDSLSVANIHSLVGENVGAELDTSTPALEAVTPGCGSLEVSEIEDSSLVEFDNSLKGIKFTSDSPNTGKPRLKFDLTGFGPYFYADGTEPNQPEIAFSFWFRFLQRMDAWTSSSQIAGINRDNQSEGDNLGINHRHDDLQMWYKGKMTAENPGVDYYLPAANALVHIAVSPTADYRNGTLDYSGTKDAYLNSIALGHKFFFGCAGRQPAGDCLILHRMVVQDLNGESMASFVTRERTYIDANKTRIPWHTSYAG